jgi:hypothetical protein
MRVQGAVATDMAVGAKLVRKGTVPFMLGRSAMSSRERTAQGLETLPLRGVSMGPATTIKGSVKVPPRETLRKRSIGGRHSRRHWLTRYAVLW